MACTAFFKVSFALAVGVGQAVGCDLDRSDFSTFLDLDQHGGDRLGGRSLGHNRPVVAVKLDGGSLNHVGVLPEPGISGIESDGRTAMGRHGAGGHVNGVGRSQKGAIRLRFQVAVGALHVAFGEGVPGRAIQAHGAAGSGHASVDDAGRAGQNQHLVGRSVDGVVAPGFAIAVRVGNASLLHDRIDAAARDGKTRPAYCWC